MVTAAEERPILTAETPATDFRRFYWRKDELIAFCRAHGLPTGGAKGTIAARIELFLRDGQIPVAAPAPARAKRATPLPSELTPETVIGEGWTCGQVLRAFFRQEIGPRFHFNEALRVFIRTGAGKTLGAAVAAWQAAEAQPPGSTDIAPQFEYNRHMREYHRAHAEATRQEAIAAWKEHRARPRPDEQPRE